MSDERVKIAYDAAVDALGQQDQTLGALRSRATGVLSAAALATSFSTGVGLFGTDPSKGRVLAAWTAIFLLAILVLIGVLTMVILWPARNWAFGPAAELILSKVDRGLDLDGVHREMAMELTAARRSNASKLRVRHHCIRGAVALLVAEVTVLVVGILSA